MQFSHPTSSRFPNDFQTQFPIVPFFTCFGGNEIGNMEDVGGKTAFGKTLVVKNSLCTRRYHKHLSTKTTCFNRNPLMIVQPIY